MIRGGEDGPPHDAVVSRRAAGPSSASSGRRPQVPDRARGLSSGPMQDFLSAIESDAPGEEIASLPLPGTYRAAFVRRADVAMFDGLDSADKDPRKSLQVGEVPLPELAPDEAYVRGDGQCDQLQHGVDVDLRAAPDLRLPRPTGQGVGLGCPSRARLPHRRLGRLGGRAPDRIGGSQLEAGRPGDHPLQLRRRPEPERARRLDAGGQSADLGLRDQLRGTGRPDAGQGQPADAEARPPDVGGGRGQRAVQLDLVPHDRLEERGAHAARGQGPGLGGLGRARCLRGAVRDERWRHSGRGGVLTREGGAPPRPRRRGGDRPQGGRLPVLEGRAHPGRVGVAPVREGHPRPGRRRRGHRVRASRPSDDGRVGLRGETGRHRSSPVPRPPAT